MRVLEHVHITCCISNILTQQEHSNHSVGNTERNSVCNSTKTIAYKYSIRSRNNEDEHAINCVRNMFQQQNTNLNGQNRKKLNKFEKKFGKKKIIMNKLLFNHRKLILKIGILFKSV